MPELPTTAQRVTEILVDFFMLDGELPATHRLADDLGADSLDLMDLLLELDDEFNVAMDYAPFVKCLTVGDVIAFVEKHLAGAHAAQSAD